MGNKTEKILSQITQTPAQIRLGQVATLIDDFKKKKKVAGKDENLDQINTEISRLSKLQKGLKNGTIKPEDVVLIHPVVEPKTEEVDATPDPVNETAVAPEQPADIIVNEEKADEQEPAEVPTVDNEKISEIKDLEKEKRQTYMEAIKLGKEMGQSKEALVKLGISRDLIDEVYGVDVKTTEQTVANTNEAPAVDQEKLKALIEMVVARNKEKKERKKELVELVALREQLLAQEELGRGTPNIGYISEEEKGVMKENIELISNEICKKYNEIKELGFFGYFKSKKKERKLEEDISKLSSERRNLQIKIEEDDIELDRKEKPLEYSRIEKIKNQDLLESLKGTWSDKIDLRKFEKGNYYKSRERIYFINDKEGILDFNIFGFTKVLKNAKDLYRDGDGMIDSKSEKGVFKIVGPDGTIIMDNIAGYKKATQVYEAETDRYKISNGIIKIIYDY